MNLETLSVARDGGVATVTLDRPPVNAVNRQMQRDLKEAFETLPQDRDLRAIVLAGAGEKAFCAGVDLKEVATRDDEDPGAPLKDKLNPGHEWRSAQHAMRHCEVPVIGAVERPAIGAGFALVALCDVIIVSETATIGLTEINVGLLGGASKALRMVGPYKARAMMFTGQMLGADDLYRLGVAEEVVPAGEALGAAQRLAAEIASKSPLAMRLAKESILRIEGDAVETQYRTEWDYTNRLRRFADSKEALAAQVEKRAPSWTLS